MLYSNFPLAICFTHGSVHMASLLAQLVKNPPAVQETGLIPVMGKSAGEGIGYPLQYSWASLVAQLVENLPGMRETWVQSLGWEDLLEKEMATCSNILAWRIPWTEEPDGLQSIGSYRQGTITPSGSDESAISLALSFYFLICKMGQ